MTGGLLARAMPAAALSTPPLRRLRLFNAHTRETFEGVYRDDDGPIATAMEDLSHLMRDHHSGERIAIDIRVLDFLAAVVDSVGAGRATVLSGYRTLATNRKLASTTFGVADNSQHLYGRALDIRLETRLQDAMEMARKMQRGGVGWYPRSGFFHIDTGRVRHWTLEGKELDHLLLLPQDLVARGWDQNDFIKSAKRSGPSGNNRAQIITTRTELLLNPQQRSSLHQAIDNLFAHPFDRGPPRRR